MATEVMIYWHPDLPFVIVSGGRDSSVRVDRAEYEELFGPLGKKKC